MTTEGRGVAGNQASDKKFDLELALHGPDPRRVLPELFEELKGTGAERMVEERVAKPEPGKRDAGILDVLTIAVGGVANVVTVVDAVYRWLGARKKRGAELPAAEDAEQILSVTITSNGTSVTLTYPSDWLQSQAVDEFLREHGQERPGS